MHDASTPPTISESRCRREEIIPSTELSAGTCAASVSPTDDANRRTDHPVHARVDPLQSLALAIKLRTSLVRLAARLAGPSGRNVPQQLVRHAVTAVNVAPLRQQRICR